MGYYLLVVEYSKKKMFFMIEKKVTLAHRMKFNQTGSIYF